MKAIDPGTRERRGVGAGVAAMAVCLGAMAAAVGGCAAGNDRLDIGHGELTYLPAEFGGETGPGMAVAPGSPEAAPMTRLSRAAWTPTTVLVPVDGIEVNPTYAPDRALTDATARQRGEFPLITSALEGAGESTGDQVREVVFSPFLAVYDGLMLVPRFFTANRPWARVRSVPLDAARAPLMMERRVPPRVEPAHMEPAHMEPPHMEPAHMEPAHMEPPRVEPPPGEAPPVEGSPVGAPASPEAGDSRSEASAPSPAGARHG